MTSVHNLAPPGPIIPSFWASFDLLQSTCLVLARIANTGWRWEWFTERSMRQYELRRHMLRKDVQNRKTFAILAPRGQAPFGQHQESRPLGRSCTVSPRFADFSSPCECSESNLANLMSWEYETITLRMFRQLDLPGRGPDSWYWLKGARSLGTRMTLYRNKCYNHLRLPTCYPLNTFGIFSAISIFRTFFTRRDG